jgi:cysteine desulfurase
MSLSLPIYLDYHATTPVDPRALEAMLPYFNVRFGNAASRSHKFGWDAEKAVETARQQLASLIGASPHEIVFTSGATESNNLAIKGVASAYRDRGDHIVTTVIEHKSVLDACKHLEKEGWHVTYLPVDRDGRVDPRSVEETLTAKTVLVSVMAANNEIGSLQPLAEIGALTRARDVLFHTDAAQAAGKIPLDVQASKIDLLSFTGHKMYGPKGVGALYVRKRSPRIQLAPLLHGGGQERGVRSGTLNVPSIVGFGKAAEINREEMPSESARLGALRDRLLERLSARLPGVGLNGPRDNRLPHNLNVHFSGVEGESILMAIDEIALSSGSACSSGAIEPSYVLKAIGMRDSLALASVRFGLGRFTTEEEVDYAADKVASVITHLRARRAGAHGGHPAPAAR